MWVAWAHVQLRKIDYQCRVPALLLMKIWWSMWYSWDWLNAVVQYFRRHLTRMMTIWSTHVNTFTIDIGVEAAKKANIGKNDAKWKLQKVSSWPAKSNVCRVITSQRFQNSPKSTLNFQQLTFERGSKACMLLATRFQTWHNSVESKRPAE